MISTIKTLFSFIRKPHLFEEKKKIDKSVLLTVFFLYIATYSIQIFWLLTVNKYIHSNFNIERSEIVDTNSESIWMFFFSAVFAYPIAEEFIFRYFLKGKKVLTLFIFSLTLSLSFYWCVKGFHYPDLLVKRIILVTVLILPLLLGIWLYSKSQNDTKFDACYKKYYFIPFYFSALCFAALHILNFNLVDRNYLALPLMIPFIIVGLSLGYARLKFGMWANLLMHIGFNLTTFILDKGLGL